ncbi:sulfite dehydrogenase [Arcobacter sp. F2176]|uniref:sulfite dehydrogenase n=1 Tax=Arcobacter sp. F2176 TaxID=2044511 RepID=UPI00100BC5E6|nr:sulfite dehydrogenase [Arcobacter sp. F2176]RXJ82754.1 sulfite dehydrogenase [Arcobacter sp. F2176]
MTTKTDSLEKIPFEKDDKISRRNFFKKTAIYSASAITAANILAPVKLKADDLNIVNQVEWGTKLGDRLDKNLYGFPSPYEHNNIRRIHDLLSSGDRYATVSMSPLHQQEGIITPNGLFFCRSHSGIAQVDPSKYRLMLHGLLEKPLVLTLEQLKRYPSESRIYFIECPANGSTGWRGPQFNNLQFVKGMMSSAEWTGVRLSVILEDLGLKPEAQWMLAEGSDDSEMARSIPIEKVLDDAMIVWGQNGEPLRPEQGYPVRLLVPGWEGNLNVKWLKRLKFDSKPWHSKEETSKYTMLQPSGKAIEFFWPMEVNSIITSPCPEVPWTDLKIGDKVEITGIAWSGRGTIKTVDISLDGGKNWVEAYFKGLILPKSWTRFSYIITWDGNPKVLLSRAIDDSGHIQPSIDKLVSKVGVEGIYHRNPIVGWEVTSKGVVNNVHIRS